MKKIRTYNQFREQSNLCNESVRDLMKPKSEEEIDIAIKNEWQRMLDVADETGTSKSRISFLSNEYNKYTEDNMLADRVLNDDISYILYKDKVYEMAWIEGGTYYVELYNIPTSVDELKIKLKEMLKKLE